MLFQVLGLQYFIVSRHFLMHILFYTNILFNKNWIILKIYVKSTIKLHIYVVYIYIQRGYIYREYIHIQFLILLSFFNETFTSELQQPDQLNKLIIEKTENEQKSEVHENDNPFPQNCFHRDSVSKFQKSLGISAVTSRICLKRMPTL